MMIASRDKLLIAVATRRKRFEVFVVRDLTSTPSSRCRLSGITRRSSGMREEVFTPERLTT
jgi:hypothetical protein